ncbi:MBG domain-containing protein [Pusillimonas sp.]|uniref:two-partner secretion domain-containing protein n=1 Tax=Pusillimonas sp. TaxID=3040095 RepID=UPI0029BD61B0|nr:MBG domain-containing protein [Pusillimonas sp.]MDX3895689.1 MBG domain-containing protein [Pusillimonas sp.]
MNRIFSIVSSRARGAWLVAGLFASATALGQGLPAGGQVVAGSGSIGAAAGGKLVIDQASHRLAIDWRQFNIGADNTVQFNQPGRDAVALNRVLGPDASQVMGQLQANGRVFLINPNGVLFGQNAQVNVGGLVASTLDIGNADFMAGHYRFQGNGNPASVVNRGRIDASDGGAVALLGGQVHNQGVIQARMGTVALAAGNAVTLDFAGDGLLNVQVDQAAKNALVDNGQFIQADGGQVIMTASASDALLQTVVNNTGVVEARTLENRAGKIVLLGDFAGGTVKVGGKLDASAPDGGDGGFIDTSGANVEIMADVEITTMAEQGEIGTWLIDPRDFTVEAGKGWGKNRIGAETLGKLLRLSNITLHTIGIGRDAGNIYVDAPVSWDSRTLLSMVAHNDIDIKASIVAPKGHIAALARGDIHIAKGVEAKAASMWLAAADDVNVHGAIDAGRLSIAAGSAFNTGADSSIAIQKNFQAVSDTAVLSGQVYSEGRSILFLANHIAIDGSVSMQSDKGYIGMKALDGLTVNGDISLSGRKGAIDLSGDSIVVNGKLSVMGRESGLMLSGGNIIMNGAMSAAGKETQILLETCSCDLLGGDIAINGDVSVNGEGYILVSSDGAVLLDGNLSAEAVFIMADGNVEDTGKGVITAYQLEARSEDGAIALSRGVHQVHRLEASGQNGLSFTNGKRLEVEEATVAGDGNILIRTTAGDLVLIPPFGPTMMVPPSGVVRVFGKGDIDLVSAGAFRNETGADALQANDGNWRVWSQSPTQTDLDGLAYDFKQYNARYGSSAVLGQGNGVLYTLAPVLDVGLKGVVAKTYDGTDAATITDSNYVLESGLQDGDHVVFSKPTKGRYSDQNAATGKTVTVDGLRITEAYEADSGAKIYGYRINASASADVGRIDRRAITISAQDQGKVYGNADPSLSYTVGGQGLVSGDSLNGALARAGGENVGSYVIGPGSLDNANYKITDFSGAALSIVPRSIVVTADDQSKYFGQADPALTWRVTGGSLAFDDRLSGVLGRDPGEGLGAYAIRQGSLAAGGNYVLDFVDGQLVVLPGTLDDYLGDLAPAYHAATVSAQNLQQGPMAFDQQQGDGTAGPASGDPQSQSLYHIENNGLRMPEGI